MPVANAVEAVLGRTQLKWDALWRLFAWLLDPNEGHGLGANVMSALHEYAFGRSLSNCQIKREFQLSAVRDGKGKWPDLAIAIPSFQQATHIIVMDDVDLRSPGAKRKLGNLTSYRELARTLFPSATIRAVVLTNANDGAWMGKLYEHMGGEAADFTAMDGWRLLPLKTVGSWVSLAIQSALTTPTSKMEYFLRDFVEWSESLDSRPVRIASSFQMD